MDLRSPKGLLSQRAIFSPLLLGFLVSIGCSSDADRRADALLRDTFPRQSAAILGNLPGWYDGAGHHIDPASSAWRPFGLKAVIGDNASDGILLRGRGDVELKVTELTASGRVRQVDGAISYARDGGHAFWTSAPGGVEEWLLVTDDVTDAAKPVAVWQVDGGWLKQTANSVEIAMPGDNLPSVQVTAPRAYGPRGESIEARLVVVDNRIELHVDAMAAPLLIDPLWIDYASMPVARYDHAQATLGNGQVIVTGGEGFGPPIGSSALYDPATATWTATAAIGGGRKLLTGTSLDDGTALFAGGTSGFSELSGAQRFNPATNQFSSAGNMAFGRFDHTATKLNDGRVLVCGGTIEQNIPTGIGGGSQGFGVLDACEIYDPMGMTPWSLQGFMSEPRQAHTAARLNDGRVMVCGGCDDFGGFLSSCEIWDPQQNNWSTTPNMNVSRAHQIEVVLNDGRVLVAGGSNFSGALNNSQVYDPVAQTWAATGSLGLPRTFATADLLADGTVLIVGGYDNQFNPTDTAELFDPATNTWTATDSITDARARQRSSELPNTGILVSGGEGQQGPLQTSMVYLPQQPDGEPCTLDTGCLSNNCVDGVCCDTGCTGSCEACSVGLKGGGTEGVCEPILNGFDPDNECIDQGVVGCGTNGSCDGQGTCAFYPATAVCAGSTCQGDDVIAPDLCDGMGMCIDSGTQDCGFYTCSTDGKQAGCTTACKGDAECAVDGYCDSNSECIAKKPLGDPAGDPSECLSGFLADGVCCDTACDVGQCDACTIAAGGTADGTCTPVVGSCDDSNECTLDVCMAEGCGFSNKLDGTPCGGGICIAGACVPDASTSSTTTTTTTTTGGGVGGSGGAEEDGGGIGIPELEGGGFCNVSRPGEDPRQPLWPAWMLVGLVALRRRRAGAGRVSR